MPRWIRRPGSGTRGSSRVSSRTSRPMQSALVAARHSYLERITMTRQNLFSDLWDGEDETGMRRRVFWRPDDARMGATLYELAPGTPLSRMHMHYGAEEMFLDRKSVV